MKTIDLTPTWGEVGLLYARLAASREVKALEHMRPEAARAFAAAQALQAITATLTDAQADIVARTLAAELTKQGY
ncbi:hypothetical protein [Burkholderia cepacia]|uniref:hypothetical protein n=1 Tax=Burkholderia cepacia TaxID=292 RepID=UPI00075F2559|nr:hypothetical protein [Burkholderia cepacia]KWH50716.1 hypothetical protein WM00_20650 [Burkholderia cepacia]